MASLCSPSYHSLHSMIALNTRSSNSKRITIVLHRNLFTQLQERCDHEGRSLSNLCSYLLERSMNPS